MKNEEDRKMKMARENAANNPLKMRNRITRLDHAYSDEKLIMIKNPPMPPGLPILVEDYQFAQPDSKLIVQWKQALVDLDFVQNLDEAEFQWQRMVKVDEKFLLDHLYMIVDAKGNLACSAGLWPYKEVKNGMRLHWVFTVPAHQHKGLARSAVQKCCYEFGKEFKNQPIYLSTQASSWPAIVLYESEGFEPYTPTPQAKQAWDQARKQILQGEQIQI